MGTNKAGEIYYANETITTNPQWKKVNGGLNMVSLSNKEVYGINTPGELYYSSDYTTGNWSILIKIICHDNEHLMQLLNKKIQPIDGVSRTETFISLEQQIERQIQL